MEPNDYNSNPRKVGGYSRLFDPANIILTIAVTIAIAFLVSFSRANYSLSKENEQLRKTVARTVSPEVGDAVPPFETTDLEGKQVNVNHSKSQKQILFILSTDCSVCAEQLPSWNRIAAQLNSANYIVRGVSLNSADETKKYFEGKDHTFQIVLAPVRSFVRTYRVSKIPQTVIISEEGIVEWSHTGLLPHNKLEELALKLGVNKLAFTQ